MLRITIPTASAQPPISFTTFTPPIKTFLDVGMRAFDILMSQNLQADLRLLDTVNQICERYAAELGTQPEQLRLEIGNRSYRLLKAFTVRPR